MGRGYTSGGQESGSVFSAVVCYRLGKHTTVKGPLYSCLLIVCLPSESRTLT